MVCHAGLVTGSGHEVLALDVDRALVEPGVREIWEKTLTEAAVRTRLGVTIVGITRAVEGFCSTT